MVIESSSRASPRTMNAGSSGAIRLRSPRMGPASVARGGSPETVVRPVPSRPALPFDLAGYLTVWFVPFSSFRARLITRTVYLPSA